MHELAITRNIVAIVGEAAQGRRVTRVTLEIGKLSGVMAEAIAFCFEAVVAGTPLGDAALDIRAIEGRGQCRECGAEFVAKTLFAACPCGSRHVQRLAGEELKIRAIELADKEAA